MPTRDLSLAEYNRKRDFTKTAEPAGEEAAQEGWSFVVQKHDATRLHFDFRLELGGVLKSWAVTRGPSPDPDDKRLAVRTEDHPLSYASFEGTIPKGEYGAGTVMLWDRGRWVPHPGKDPVRTLEEGHLHFTLEGERMRGEWVMFRLKPRPKDRTENWILRKVQDEFAAEGDLLVERELTSIETGRTMIEIEAGAKSKRVSRRKPGSSRSGEAPSAKRLDPGVRRGTKKAKAPPPFRPVQLATLADAVPTGAGWIHEIKYDGYRALVGWGGGQARAWTRNELEWSDRFRDVVDAAAQLPGSGLIDGEVVRLDGEGKPSFQLLQAALKDGGTLDFFAFDLLALDGEDVGALPTVERKGKLAALLANAPPRLHYAEHVAGAGEKLFATLCGSGHEGVISKRADAPYRGRRTADWLKVKCLNRQEFAIVGWTVSDKGRGFRSLLLGVNEGGELRYAGKAGTGFDARTIETLLDKMRPLERDTPTVKAPRAAVRGAHWVEPELVAEVAFTEWTTDGVLRHPSFVGLREDKTAEQVTKDVPRRTPEPGRSGKAPDANRLGSGVRRSTWQDLGARITNPDRVIFPDAGITKGELADYYAGVATPMLEWLARRPVSLVRCPQGRAKHCFFQKHDAGSFGDAVKHVPVTEAKGGTEDYLYVEDVHGVLACVQMGTIEFHGWGSRVDDYESPDRLVFDLDPDEGLGFDAVKAGALRLRALLADMGLVTFPLLSGGKGVHVVVPLDASRKWPEVKSFADRFSRALAAAEPDHFTANMRKTERKGRIFLDWLRNQRGATAILPYSARARPGAPVSAPIHWDELESYNSGGHFTIRDADALLERAQSKPLQGWGEASQALPDF